MPSITDTTIDVGPLTQDPTKASVMYRCIPCGAILDPDTEWGSDCHHCGAVVHMMQQVRIICADRQLQRQFDQEDQADLYATHMAWGEARR